MEQGYSQVTKDFDGNLATDGLSSQVLNEFRELTKLKLNYL